MKFQRDKSSVNPMKVAIEAVLQTALILSHQTQNVIFIANSRVQLPT